MRNPFACAAVLVIISFTHLPAAAQTSQPLPPATADNSKSFAIPRLADGHPNLQGLWHNEVGTAALRQAGFSDRDIWDIAAVAGFFNMTNRVASATDMRPNSVYHGQSR